VIKKATDDRMSTDLSRADAQAPQAIDNPFDQCGLGVAGDEIPRHQPGEPPPQKFTFAIYLLIVLLGALAGLGPFAIDMYLPSFSAIASDLHSSLPAVQRTLSAYFVGIALGQLIYGPASDRYGRTKPLYVGLVVFALASIGCAFATSITQLVVLRFLQALGGCAEMVIARAVVRDRFSPRDSIRVFSGLVLVMGIAPILAPLLGGWIVTYWSWRAIFYFLGGFAIALLVLAVVMLPESHPVNRRTPLSVGGTLATYRMLLRDRLFMGYTLVVSFQLAALFAYVGGSPLVFMEIFHVSPTHFGWFFGANAAGLIAASQVNGYLAHHGADPHRVLGTALTVATLGATSLLIFVLTGVGGFWPIYFSIFTCLASCGFIFANATVLAMAKHGKHAGNASALLGCIQFGISGLGGFAVSAFQHHSALPMAITLFACIAIALAILVSMRAEPVEAGAVVAEAH
jgi:DHA1 family bicyclomycin/chloramphenicol resistance-like MFS transporter